MVYQNQEAKVWRFADGEWTDLGRAAEKANRISLTMDPALDEIVAATDESVVRFDGTVWQALGEGGIGDQGAIAAASDGLFLAWEGNDYNLWIDKATDDGFVLQECSMTRKRAENYHLAAGPNGELFAGAKLYVKGSPTTHGGVVYGFDRELNAWKELGGVIHDGNEVYDNDLAVSAEGLPYLAYGDFLGSSFSVVRYDGEGDWTYVGLENILDDIGYHPAITFSPQGSVPIVAYTESAQQSDGYARVMYYNGSEWVWLGESYNCISDKSMKAHPAVAVGADGTVYVAYWDLVDGAAAVTVKKYSEKFDVSGALAEDKNGGGESAVALKDAPRAAWPVVGTYGFTEDLDGVGLGAAALIVDDKDDLYAGYIDASSSTADAGVWKFDGAAWTDFGDVSSGVDFTGGLSLLSQGGTLYAGVSTGLFFADEQDEFSLVAEGKLQGNLAADPLTGALYSLVYTSSTKQLVVSQLDAGVWAEHSAVDVPQTDGLDHAASPSLAVAQDGTMYMSYQLQNAGTLTLMQYNGTDWEVLDTPIADASEEVYRSKLILSPSDVPHLVIVEAHAAMAVGVSADDLSVLRFENGTHKWLQRRSILWGGEASEGAVSEPSAVFTSDGTLLVAFTYKLGSAGPIQALVYNEDADTFEVIGGRDVINGHWESLADRAALAVDSKDNVYLGYDDGNNAHRFTVRRLVIW